MHQGTIPVSIRRAIIAHAQRGQECGHFVTAVLENDLTQAVMRADDENLQRLRDIVGYCYNQLPGPSWGSPAAVKAWRKRGGDPSWKEDSR